MRDRGEETPSLRQLSTHQPQPQASGVHYNMTPGLSTTLRRVTQTLMKVDGSGVSDHSSGSRILCKIPLPQRKKGAIAANLVF